MSGIKPSSETPARQALRLGLGVVITFALAQLFKWPTAHLAPAFVVVLLQEPVPLSLRQGWRVFRTSVFFVLLGAIVTLVLSPWPPLLVLAAGFLFYRMFIFMIQAGATVLEIVSAMVGFTIIPVLVNVLPELGFLAVWYFLLGYAVAILTAWFAWMCVPLLSEPPHAHHDEFLSEEVVSSMALNLALVMTLLMGLFLMFGWTQILVLVYAIIFATTYDARGGGQMGVKYVIANVIYGGVAMILTYELIVMAPSFLLMVPVVFLVACIFGVGTFRGGSTADFWNSGTFGFLIVLGDLLMKDGGYSIGALSGRVWQMILATAYITLAFSIIEMIRHQRKERLVVNPPLQSEIAKKSRRGQKSVDG
jgi:hypothetical protein